MELKKLSEVKEFTIKRSEWLRGDNPDTILLRSDGGKCCLGFFMLAAGSTEDNIRGHLLPNECYGIFQPQMMVREAEDEMGVATSNSTLCGAAVHLNDAVKYSEPEREEGLIKLFAANGVTVNFVD